MTRLFFVRHAPTHAKAMVGWSDLPADLSDRAVLDRLATRLPGKALIVSSDLCRTIATADAIQRNRQRLPHEAALREIHFGEWELRNWREIEAADPERARRWWENPGDVRPPGGESWNELRARVDAALERLVAAHAGRDLIVVAHFGVILTQIQRALGLTAKETFSYHIDNLSVTELARHGNGWEVTRVNHPP